MLDDGQQIGERLERVIPVALHVHHRSPAGFGDRSDVLVANAPVDVADGNAVVVAAQDVTDLLPRVTVADLGRRRVEEHRVAAELCHSGLEAGSSSRAREEEQHGEHFVVEEGMRLAERPPFLEIEGDIDDGVELVLGPFLGRDHVPTLHVCLHEVLLRLGLHAPLLLLMTRNRSRSSLKNDVA